MFRYLKKQFFVLTYLTLYLTQSPNLCAYPEPSLISASLIPSETLAQTAQQCRQAVDQLWTQQRRLGPEQRRDFHIAIGHASKNCDDLREIYEHLKKGASMKHTYDQFLSEAQAIAQEVSP